MSAQDLLARCDKVRRTGKETWIACCPGHEDKNPSMTVRELADGRVLVHCFSGCGVEQILSGAGLTFDALFPEKQSADFLPQVRRPFPAADVLEAVSNEVFYVAYMAETMAQGYTLEPRDKAILDQSYDRIMEARRLALGER